MPSMEKKRLSPNPVILLQKNQLLKALPTLAFLIAKWLIIKESEWSKGTTDGLFV